MALFALLGPLLPSAVSVGAPAASVAAPPAPTQAAPTGNDNGAPRLHALATLGEPKYPRGFTHFGYVNPNAPRTGTLYLPNPDRRTSFDKFNPFTIRGNAPGGVFLFMFESLAVYSADEPSTMYGLLAEAFTVAADKSSITFQLHPAARFNNGDAVTPADVKHSFEALTGKLAMPRFRTLLAGAERAVVVDSRTIRFDMKDRTHEAMINLGTSLMVFSRKWGAGADGTPKPLDQIVTEYPISTGAYTIARADSGRRIELVRNPEYWARDAGVRRGHFNFDRIVYRYYKDRAVTMEAFKAGEFDLLQEYSGRRWVRQHEGPKWRDGRIVKHTFEDARAAGLQGYEWNLRRPLFQDRRVREALTWTYDFEAVNRLKLYQRAYSLFNNSEFAATGVPNAGELKLLEPFRAELPPEVFGLAWRPPTTDADPRSLRRNLLKARELLEQAGWKLAPDGKLRNGNGELFVFEYLTPEEGGARGVASWQRNLEKLGIEMKVRRVDFALYRKRLEVFDFDMIVIVRASFNLPDGSTLADSYGSRNAEVDGSNNFIGIRNRVLDRLADSIQNARTMDELRDACRAFDRVFMNQHYKMPELYSGTYRVSYWAKLGVPAVHPKFYTMDSPNYFLPAWGVSTWWVREPDPRQARG